MTPEAQVLIVGAGPTGLALGLWLTRLGVRVRICEKNDGPGQTSRAMVVQARTLEFYRQLGIADEIVECGIRVGAFHLYSGGREASAVRFGDIGKGLSPYPFVLSLPQDEHERILGKKLGAWGVPIEWNTELTGFSDSGEEIEATLRSNGREETCRVSYLCGCDGIHSTVRESSHLKFAGGLYQHRFFVADLAAEGAAVNGDINFFIDADEIGGAFPIRSSGMVRLIGIIPGEQAANENVTFEEIRAHFERPLKLRVRSVNWFSTYHVHHRVSEHFRVGRAFVLGDAGHVHSPVGGQGMNTGIGDAINLSWKLAAVLGRRADPSILDTYESERIAFARSLVSTTDRIFQLVVQESFRGKVVRWVLFSRVLPILLGFPAARKLQFRLVSQIRINYRGSSLSEGRAGDVSGGDRLPWLESADGGNFEPLKSLDWQIHVYGQAGAPVTAAARESGIALDEFPWSEKARAAGFERDALYLVRPDGHVALADSGQDAGKLRRFLARFKIAARNAA